MGDFPRNALTEVRRHGLYGPEFSPYLGKKDANDCINGKKCVNLPVVLAQFLAKFEDLLTPRKPG